MVKDYAHIRWMDQNSIYSDQFEDFYFSHAGAREEAQHVFLDAIVIDEIFTTKKQISILELGFGAGINFIETCLRLIKISPGSQVFYTGIEKYPFKKSDLSEFLSKLYLGNEAEELLENYNSLLTDKHISLFSNHIQLKLLNEDISESIKKLSGPYDIIYLDGFNPKTNPEMWSLKLFQELKKHCSPSSRLSTYSASSMVQRNFKEAGFIVKKVKGFGKKREMICAYPETETKTSNGQLSSKYRT